MGIFKLNEHTKLVDKSFMNMLANNLFSKLSKGDQVDFKDVMIDKYMALDLARLLDYYDLSPVGLDYPHDVTIITALAYIREPNLDYDTWFRNFQVKFPPGTACIKDTFFAYNTDVGKHIAAIVVEDIQKLNVRVRKYHSSSFQNLQVWLGKGGPNGRDNFQIENIRTHDIFHKNPFVRMPISAGELDTLRKFFPKGSIRL